MEPEPESAEEARARWDRRWIDAGPLSDTAEPYELLAAHESRFPTSGTALEVACGRGRGAVWLALRGLDVVGVDVSPVAIELARQLSIQCGVAERCHFAVHDLATGLPPGDPVDVVVCHLFRDPDLDADLVRRLKPDGLLAVVALSEVGHGPGRFRAKPGELAAAFAELDIIEAGEGDGHAWLLGRRRAAGTTG